MLVQVYIAWSICYSTLYQFFLMILAAIDAHEELQNGDFLFLVLSAFISDDGKTFSHQFFGYLEIQFV